MAPDKEIIAVELLQKSAAVAAMSPSINLWEDLVTRLAQALQVDWAFVGKLLPGSHSAVRTLAVCYREKIIENFEYQVDTNPARDLQSGDIRLCLKQACNHVPSEWVKQVKAEAFGEATLIDSLGQSRGILAFAHSRPLEREDLIGPVLKIFAFKAAVELERELADDRFYRELLNGLLRPRAS
ncbi:MAG TPA: hypothetical protein VH601_13180 [Bryobacteraceae bacterium]|jgi:hypothetical protein